MFLLERLDIIVLKILLNSDAFCASSLLNWASSLGTQTRIPASEFPGSVSDKACRFNMKKLLSYNTDQVNFFLLCFFYLGFLSRIFTIYRTAGEGGG